MHLFLCIYNLVTFALQHPLSPNKEEWERTNGQAVQFARNGLYVGGSRVSALAVRQSSDTCEWVSSTWTVRLYDTNQVAGFHLNI